MPAAVTGGGEPRGRGDRTSGPNITPSPLATTRTIIFYGFTLFCQDLLRHFHLLTVQCLNASQWRAIKHMDKNTNVHFSFAEDASRV